jgi:cyd operon protein YbgE
MWYEKVNGVDHNQHGSLFVQLAKLKKIKRRTVWMRISTLNYYIDILHWPFKFLITRLCSLLLALFLSGLLLIYPNHIAASSAQLDHGYLIILMLALSAAFIHGVGFYPHYWLWKILFSPYFSLGILVTFIFNSVV